jgi:zinc/manganese transport system ATP-binding protein
LNATLTPTGHAHPAHPPVARAAAAPDVVLEDLTLGYDSHPAVHHLNATVPGGSLLALVGPNGAGKSTLLRALAGELVPLQGRIRGLQPPTVHANGRFWQRFRRGSHGSQNGATRVAHLAQHTDLDRRFPLDVGDLVAMGLWHEVGALRGLTAGQRARVQAALETVGLQGFANRPIGSLSGGQLQRALFARLWLQDAPVVLLDEPFAGVDARTCRDLLGVLAQWHARGKTVVAVLHDLEQVRAHFPTTLLLARERVAMGPTAGVLTEANLARARQLNEAFDPHAPWCHAPVPDDAAAHGTTARTSAVAP